MDCSPPVSSAHGILQARILKCVAISSFKGSSLVTQKIKNLPAMRETQTWSLDREATLKGMATRSSILAWRISWTEEPAECSPQDGKESDMTEQLTLFTFMSIESAMLSNHLILCCPLLLPSIFPRKERFIFFNIKLYFINKKWIDQQRNISKYIYIYIYMTLYFYVPFTPKWWSGW